MEVPEVETSKELIRLEDFHTDSSSILGTDGSDTWHRQLGSWQHWQQALGIGQLGKLAHGWRLDGHWTRLGKLVFWELSRGFHVSYFLVNYSQLSIGSDGTGAWQRTFGTGALGIRHLATCSEAIWHMTGNFLKADPYSGK